MPVSAALSPTAPPHASLSGALRLGAVHLRTRAPDRLAAFYEQVVGLARLPSQAGGIALGAGDTALIVLEDAPDAIAPPPRAPGLFHTAIRVPDRASLAVRMNVLRAHGVPFGASDHLVSEALYFDDPDGNGIEIYRDRPKAEWFGPDGKLQMATLRLDLNGLAGESSGLGPAPTGTDVGHVHLKVSDLAAAHRFWVELAGFEVMARYPGALFVSAGKYHHHLGLNVWHSQGAAPPPAHASGLAGFEIALPAADIAAIRQRFAATGTALPEADGAVLLEDPAGNRARLSVLRED
ncbi:VOC family protein [Roseixanthobacter glucoisosaccharinicivorans]|uniref:VOC family protein n=1 Tax=Roseixanthobacter glucoisosaccharinicivorans TaxID=3119923 RepID=UPI00372A0173